MGTLRSAGRVHVPGVAGVMQSVTAASPASALLPDSDEPLPARPLAPVPPLALAPELPEPLLPDLAPVAAVPLAAPVEPLVVPVEPVPAPL